MQLIGDTHVGIQRKSNQDVLFLERVDGGGFVVICDGMGGEKGGNVASSLAGEAYRSMLKRDLKPGLSSRAVENIMRCAAAAANAEVYACAKQDKELARMGTTLVAATVLGNEACWIHAGDSRVYLLRDGALTQLTIDHTAVQMLVECGQLTPEAAKNHPKRHYLTRAVGTEREMSFDFGTFTLEPDDCLLLCSDGLYNYLSEGELAALASISLRRGTVSPLIERANENGGGDNITAALIGMVGKGA